jgi:hypothetical protein
MRQGPDRHRVIEQPPALPGPAAPATTGPGFSRFSGFPSGTFTGRA